MGLILELHEGPLDGLGDLLDNGGGVYLVLNESSFAELELVTGFVPAPWPISPDGVKRRSVGSDAWGDPMAVPQWDFYELRPELKSFLWRKDLDTISLYYIRMLLISTGSNWRSSENALWDLYESHSRSELNIEALRVCIQRLGWVGLNWGEGGDWIIFYHEKLDNNFSALLSSLHSLGESVGVLRMKGKRLFAEYPR